MGRYGSFFLALAIVCLTSTTSLGVGVFVGPDRKAKPQKLSLPYPFYNESFGAAIGYVYGVTGHPQKQSALLATAMAGTQGSAMGFLIGRDLQMPRVKRMFFDPIVSVGYFDEIDYFVDGNPAFTNERSGSNDSSQDNYVEGSGWDNFFRLRFKYLLPMGHGKDQIIGTYVIDKGLLVSGGTGGDSLNPFKSGETFLELRPFYRSQQIKSEPVDSEKRTNGFDFSVFWDNRDFFANPSKGNGLLLKVSKDFGWFDTSNSWTSLQGEWDQYFSLGATEWFRHRVIALDVWTSYSPSWDLKEDGTIENRPPAYTGATLGGLWKLRGFPAQRFSDKAAIYYAAELRLIPKWNPFDNWPWLQKHLGVAWIQFVPFGEIGRVAPSWNVSDLHEDMKWTAGMGFRFWAKGIVGRIDVASSEEGFRTQMMISQPFQF